MEISESIGRANSLAIDREINKIFIVVASTATPETSIFKIVNENGSVETARKITGIGTFDSEPRLSLYDGMLLL